MPTDPSMVIALNAISQQQRESRTAVAAVAKGLIEINSILKAILAQMEKAEHARQQKK